MFLIMTCQRQAIDLKKMNKNLKTLKTNIPDLDVLSNPLLDSLKIGIRYLIFFFFLERDGVYLNFPTLNTSNKLIVLLF